MKRDKSLEEEAAKILRGEHALNEALGTKFDGELEYSNYGEPWKGWKAMPFGMFISDRGPLLRAFGKTISLPHRKSDEDDDVTRGLPKSKDGHNLEFQFQGMPWPEELDRDSWKAFAISAIQKWLKKSPYNNWKHLYYQPKGLDTVRGNEIHYKIAGALAKSVGGELLTDFENGYHIKRK